MTGTIYIEIKDYAMRMSTDIADKRSLATALAKQAIGTMLGEGMTAQEIRETLRMFVDCEEAQS